MHSKLYRFYILISSQCGIFEHIKNVIPYFAPRYMEFAGLAVVAALEPKDTFCKFSLLLNRINNIADCNFVDGLIKNITSVSARDTADKT